MRSNGSELAIEVLRSTSTTGRTSATTAVIAALRRGDERVFAALIDAYHPALLRLAMVHGAAAPMAEAASGASAATPAARRDPPKALIRIGETITDLPARA